MAHTTNTAPTHPSPLVAILTLIWSVVFIFFAALTTVLTCLIRFVPRLFHNPLSLRARVPLLQLFSIWGVVLQVTAWTFVATLPGMNCATLMILSNVGWYSFLVALLLRGWRLYYIFHWNAREIKELIKRERREKKLAMQHHASTAQNHHHSIDHTATHQNSNSAHHVLQSFQHRVVSHWNRSLGRLKCSHQDPASSNEHSAQKSDHPNTTPTATTTTAATPEPSKRNSVHQQTDTHPADPSSTNTTRNTSHKHSPQNPAADSSLLAEKKEMSPLNLSESSLPLPTGSTPIPTHHNSSSPNAQNLTRNHESPQNASSIPDGRTSTTSDASRAQNTPRTSPLSSLVNPQDSPPPQYLPLASSHSSELKNHIRLIGTNSADSHTQTPQYHATEYLSLNACQDDEFQSAGFSSSLVNPQHHSSSGGSSSGKQRPTNRAPPTHVQASSAKHKLPSSGRHSVDNKITDNFTLDMRANSEDDPQSVQQRDTSHTSGLIFQQIRASNTHTSHLTNQSQHRGAPYPQQYPYHLSFGQSSQNTVPQPYLSTTSSLNVQAANEDHLFNDLPKQNRITPPLPATSPLQSFSLLTVNSDSNQAPPPIGPAGANSPNYTPSLGHLNLTYRDGSSNQRNRQYGDHNYAFSRAFSTNRVGLHSDIYRGAAEMLEELKQTPAAQMANNDLDAASENSFDDLSDENLLSTGVDDLASDWMDILQSRVKESTTNINKRRANEKNLLIFFFIGLFLVLIFLVPTALFMPRFYVPHSFLCDINAYAYPTTELEPRNPNQFPIFEFIFSMISVFLILIGIFKLRRVRDTYHLNTELRVMGVIIMFATPLYGIVIPFASFEIAVPLSLFLLWYTILLVPMAYYPYAYILRTCLRAYIKWYKSKRASADSERESTVGKSPSLRASPAPPTTLQGMLDNLALRDMLKKHMVHSLCSELITFYEQVSFFKLSYDEDFPDSSLKLAQDIVDTYVVDDCAKHVHLPKQVRNDIVHKVSTSVDSVPIGIFDEATRYVIHRIRRDGTFSSFKRSRKFRKWLKQQKEKKIEKVIERAGGLVEEDDRV